MKKIILLTIVLGACNKMPHLVWEQPKTVQEEHVSWACGNHMPVDIANNFKEMQNLSKEKGCRLWAHYDNDLRNDIGGVEFTFDDGPNLATTPKVLDILKKYKLRATFFVEGINLAGTSEQAIERRTLLKRISAEGHIIGNHSYDHKAFTSLSDQSVLWQIDETNKLIEDTVHKQVSLIRLPYGKVNRRIYNILQHKGLTPINWQIDPREWERSSKTHQIKTPEEVLKDIMSQYHKLHTDEGQQKMIIILHDTKKITPILLPSLLDTLLKEK